jgi:UDP-N-acetylmuramyl-tripeptide synthetase
MKRFIQKLIPSFLMSWYHLGLAFLGALFYGFPSSKLIVIGVTGTKGKTSTCNLIAEVLNQCGFKTGMATTVNFRIGDKEWVNETKQTMLGRFKLQKLLKRMVKERCKYAVVETSSEGILQHRHRFIDYKIAVFTNLSPEHIERHKGFENYRAAKVKLFKKIAQGKDEIAIINLDDENAEHFLEVPVKEKYGYCIDCDSFGYRSAMLKNKFRITDVELSVQGAKFKFNGEMFETRLLGEGNIYNAGAAICVALSQGINVDKIKKALVGAKPISGRMEVIDAGQNFTAIVDYSYEPKSLASALKAIKIFNPQKIFVVVGATGGGRDKWRRPVMGEIADKYADIVIVTTDDPYDEKPKDISDAVLSGVLRNKNRALKENVFEIIDRRQAIKKAIEMAEPGDAILFAGKGGERWMNLAKGKKIPWDESEIVREEIKNHEI